MSAACASCLKEGLEVRLVCVPPLWRCPSCGEEVDPVAEEIDRHEDQRRVERLFGKGAAVSRSGYVRTGQDSFWDSDFLESGKRR